MQQRIVRTAVVGAGRWGKNLVRVFRNLGVLAAVVDTDPSAEAIARAADVPFFSDVASLGRAGIADAVAIATPAETHGRTAMRALEYDLDLFIEKPIALNVEDAELVIAEAARRNRVLMTGHLLLFHPAVVALKRLIDDGELGGIRYVYSNRLNLGRVRREENILWSFAPHDIAVILHLVGDSPKTVSAVGNSWLQRGIADVTVTHLTFSSGQAAHVFVSWLHPYKEQKLVVVGERKMAVFNDLEPHAKLVICDAGVEVPESGPPTERQGEKKVIAVDREEPLLIEARHFLECCRTRSRPLTDGIHGLEVLRILAAAEASLGHPESPRRIDPKTMRPVP